MARQTEHPIVAALLDLFMWPFRRVRRRLIPLAHGRVLEIGVGTGLNFRRYAGIDGLWGVEPDRYMLSRAARRVRGLSFPVQLIDAEAERLPFPNGHFDSVVATWVLCTIPDPDVALREIVRVLRPGGTFIFAEHTKSRFSYVARVQALLTPLWRRLAGGCHLNRDAVTTIRAAGLQDIVVQPFGREGWTLSPVYGGVASKEPAVARESSSQLQRAPA